MEVLPAFLDKLEQSLAAGSFVKVTLSEYRGAEPGLRNLYARTVIVRGEPLLSLLWRFATRDVTRNQSPAEAIATLAAALGEGFQRAHLFTLTGDWNYRAGASLKASRPAFAQALSPEHDRPKKRLLSAAQAPFLQALGVTNASGEPRPGMADKLRQIQRFVELLGHLFAAGHRRDGTLPLRAVDIGSGKGYLTFALAEFLRQREQPFEITGIEQREDLVNLTNRVAREHGYQGLNFLRQSAEDSSAGPLDLLFALHACDTATDEAISLGLEADASLIVVAPCCHRELSDQLQSRELEPILRHGILREREAEIVTDAIRALVLEICGYQANVFEFISPEHTGKNLMISAQKRAHPGRSTDELRGQLSALMAQHGVRSQKLCELQRARIDRPA